MSNLTIKVLRFPCAADKFTIFCNMFGCRGNQSDTPAMVKRIVIMELLPGKEGLFLDIFDQVKKQIRAREGCRGLEILKSEEDGRISLWM